MLTKSVSPMAIDSVVPYCVLPLVFVLHAFLGLFLRLPLTTLFITYGLLPLLDNLGDKDWENPTLEQIKTLERRSGFRVLLYLVIVLDWAISILTLREIENISRSSLHTLVNLLLMSTLYTATFLIAHELFHKNNPVDRTIGTLHQIKCLYMHFTVQHLEGHHKRVATPEDSAFAPKGMTVYQFIPRSICRTYVSAMRLRPLLVTFFTLSHALFLLGVYFAFGFPGLAYSLVAAFGGVSMLEIINYIQHYGLQRLKLPDGTYEKVTIRHSWNAPHRFSNYLFFNLQRHSDHHSNSLKPYQTLCAYEDSPQLPHSYLICIIMALYPHKWFEVMDPLVDEYKKDNAVKGTELKWFSTSVKKSEEFVRSNVRALFLLMVLELGWQFGGTYLR